MGFSGRAQVWAFILIIFTASVSWAGPNFGAADCQAALKSNVTSSGHSAIPTASLLKSRIESASGIKIELEWEDLGAKGDASRMRLNLFDSQKNSLADFSFSISGDELGVNSVHVEPEYRRRGLSELMMALILERHPQINKISAFLVGINAEIARSGVNRGLSCADAVMTTPAYRARRLLGFTEIVNVECELRNEAFANFVDLTVKRP